MLGKRYRIGTTILAVTMFIFVVVWGITATVKKSQAKLQSRPGFVANEVIIKFMAGISDKVKAEILKQANVRIKSRLPVEGLTVINIKPGDSVLEVIEKIKSHDQVAYAEPNYIHYPDAKDGYYPKDAYFQRLWGLNNKQDTDINAPEAWDITMGNPEVIVAVLDTGIDISHKDLQNNVWINPGEIPADGLDNDGNGYIDDLNGWDFSENNNTVFDSELYDQHGTHVAGTIAAAADNRIGIAGVAPHVKIMPLKFIGPEGGTSEDLIRALNYAKMMGDLISNNSYGVEEYSQAEHDAIANFGGVYVASAGNSSLNTDESPSYPSTYDNDNIVAVAATDDTGNLAWFSNYGPETVDVAAPGIDILSLKPGNKYQIGIGTSMATPHVTGIVALMHSVNAALSATEIRSILTNTGKPVDALNGRIASGSLVKADHAVNEAIRVSN